MESKIFVLILGYNDLKNLDECLNSLLDQTYKNYEIWFADNNSNDGSVEFVNKKFSKVKTFQFNENSGYAGGNNKLIKMAFDKKADFCLVLNADTKTDNRLLSSLIKSYEKNSKKNKVGLVQPMIMLYDDPERINSSGNEIHYLGFGYCGDYRLIKNYKKDKKILSVTGAAMLVSREYYYNIGLFDEDFFMYNEDQDYSWRGFLMGYKHYLSVEGKVWHKYSFVKNERKMYFSEKNRLIMIFKNYELLTLIKIIPILIINELLILIYSIFDGWFFLKIKSYILIIKNWKKIKKRRELIQKSRLIKDKDYINKFISRLNFSEINNIGIKYIVNSVYSFYKKIIL